MFVFVCVHQQRDSGDDEDMDKNSEDEEGQLEEQIERLQEKVESAQSEQKNLFLVIFQVPIGQGVLNLRRARQDFRSFQNSIKLPLRPFHTLTAGSAAEKLNVIFSVNIYNEVEALMELKKQNKK